MTTATINYVPDDTTVSEADLLLGIHDEDPASWDEILRRYGKLVSATVRTFRLQEADAVDAMQMTWLRLAENAHRVRFPERLGGWLASTRAANACTSSASASVGRSSLTWHQNLPAPYRPVPNSAPSTLTSNRR